MAADIQAALVAFLQGRPELGDLLGAGARMRLYPEFLPADCKPRPAATYRLLQDNRPLCHGGKAGFGVATVQIDVWGAGEAQGHKQANAVYLALWGTPAAPCLDGYRGTMGGVWVMKAQCQDGAKDSPQEVIDGKSKPAATCSLTVTICFDDL